MIVDYLVGLVCAFASTAMVCLAFTTRPVKSVCPERWYVNGIRPTGAFCCLPAPIGRPEHDDNRGHIVQPPGELCSRIYCTGGAHPIVVSDRVVGCQR